MAESFRPLGHIGLAAPGTGMSGIARLGTGGSGDGSLVIVALGLGQHYAAHSTMLGGGTGSYRAGGMALSAYPLHAVIPAPGTAVFHDPGPAAGGPGDGSTIIQIMAQRLGIVAYKGASTPSAKMGSMASGLAGGRGNMGLVVVGQGVGDVLDLTLPAY